MIDYNDTTKSLRKLARELDTPVLVTTTISSEVEKRANKRHLPIDLGVWRSLEENSDTLIFLYKDELYNYDSNDKGIAEFIVAKNSSDGPVGTVRTLYNEVYCRFENFAE